MAVMAREAWTDERLDDLAKRMDKGFDDVKGDIRDVKDEIRDVKGEVRDLRSEMNMRFAAVDSRFNSIESRFESLQRTMIIGFVSLIGSVVASVLGGILITQL